MREKPDQVKSVAAKPVETKPAAQEWIDICHVDDVFEACGRRYELPGMPPLAVFNMAGEFQVADDTCTHGDASLADGWIEGTEVECPFHSGKFCLKTGKAMSYPAEHALKVYRTRVDAGRVLFDPVPIVSED